MIQNAPKTPRTLIEAVRYFADPDVADGYVASLKWPGGEPGCPECGSTNVGQIKSRRKYQCREKGCRKQFTIKSGTIFTDSPLPLDKWLIAIWMIANCRNGVSSCEIARAIGIKQQSAWHVLHRVRHAMKSEHSGKMNGVVEADCTFVGDLSKFKHLDQRVADRIGAGVRGKAVVHAMLKRKGKNHPHSTVRASVVAGERAKDVRQIMLDNITIGGTRVYTDSSSAYKWANESFVHRFVNHFEEYVRGSVHTNTAENFFSLLRRGLKGTYVAVEPKHLEAYVDEQAFRYNHRKESDWQRFDRLMKQVTGKQMTYSDLTGGKKR